MIEGRQDLQIHQPETGYRHALDPLLLAHFARVKPGERVVDLGCGVGVILLRLTRRAPGASFLGIEIQPELAAMAGENAAVNGLAERVSILTADLRALPSKVTGETFDVVVTNPPYRAPHTGRVAPDAGRAMGRHELAGGLADFLRAAAQLLKDGGRFYIVYLAERLAELLAEMRCHRLEPKRLRLVHSRAGEEARLVLVEGRRNGRTGLVVEAPLMVYDGPGRSYSAEMQDLHAVGQEGSTPDNFYTE